MKKLVLFCCLLAVSFLNAQVVYVDANATGTNDGSSWANAYTTLQQAENYSPDGADIWVAAGTYIANATDRNERILEISNSHNWYGGFNGSETQLSERNPKFNITIISGDALGNGSTTAADVTDNAYNLVRVNASVDLLFDGFTFEQAHTNSGNGLNGNGGVIQFAGLDNLIQMNTSTVFNNCIMQHNYSNYNTLYFIQENVTYYGSVDVQFNACKIINNRAYYTFQTVLDNWDNSASPYDTKHIYFTSCLIADNESTTREVFNIDLALPCDIRFINNTFANNSFYYLYRLFTTDYGILSTFQNSVQMYNNIISSPVANIVDDANAFTNVGNNIGNHIYLGANYESDASIFEDFTNSDYHLAANSPAIDNANSVYLLNNMTNDLENYPRTIGNLDIGAYEYISCDLDNLEVTSSGLAELTVTWQASPEINTPYELIIVANGQPTSSGITVSGVTNTLYTFTGLSENTTYDIYINYTCGNTNLPNSQMVTATTRAFVFVDATATGNNDGSNWSNAFTTLDAAIADVSGNNNAVIYVAKGTYTPHATDASVAFSIGIDNLEIYGGFAGNETTLSDRDNTLLFTTNATIISGDLSGNDISGDFGSNRADNSTRLVELTGNNVTLNGLVFSGAHATASNNPVINTASTANITSVTLQYCLITDNHSNGVFIDWRNFTDNITLENVAIENNISNNGVMLLQSSGNANVSIAMANIKFTGNTYNSDWGAIWFRRGNMSSLTATVANGTFIDNKNDYSTGVPNLITQSSSSVQDNVLTVSNSIFWNNQYTSGTNTLVSDTDISNPKSNEGNSQQLTVNNSIIKLVNTNFINYSVTATSTDNPNLDSAYMPTASSANVLDMGANTFNSTTTDIAGNSRIANGIIDLGAYEFAATPQDVNAPTLLVQDITVYLDANGQVNVTASDIDNGTTDDFSTTNNLVLALDITSFYCSDIGANTVVFTATDENGNSDSTTATVTVLDNIVPSVTTVDIMLDLGLNTNITITPQDILGAATDNCTISTMTLDQDTFTTVGTYTVTLTVTDTSNNQTMVTAIVTVEDTMNTEDNTLETLKIYPNPTTNMVTVSGIKAIEKLELYTLQGQKVGSSTTNQINTNQLIPGVYILKVINNEKMISSKIIKN